MKHPYSTISNIAYLIPAYFADTIILSIAFVLLALSSGAYHFSRQDIPRHADEISMYFTGFAFIYELSAIGSIESLIATILISLIFALMYDEFDSFQVMPVLMLCVWLVGSGPMDINQSLFTLGLLILAAVMSYVGRRVGETNPAGDRWHGGWHVSTSAASVFILIWT